jgi:hypothetical protein
VESLAAILGLLCNFKAGRDSKSQDEFNEFLEWLIHHKHTKVVDELNSNYKLCLSIKSLLGQNHSEVMKSLNELNSSLAEVCLKIDALKEIPATIANSSLSNQAFSIMVQLHKSGGTTFLEQISLRGVKYPISDKNIDILPSEEKHMKEDLDRLLDAGLLRVQYIFDDTRLFHITRAGEDFAQNEL